MNGSRDPAACHAAIHGLLHAIPDEQRAHAAAFLLDDLARLYEAAGRPLPDGLCVLREPGGNLPTVEHEVRRVHVLTDAGEPRMTIYNALWAAARVRLDTLEPPQRDVYAAAMDAVEDAWTHLRPLQAWYERERSGEGGGTDYALLEAFVDAELVDSFRPLCAGVADLVPGAAGGELDADPDDVNGWADVFARYMRVFRLAVAGADVPAPFREAVVDAADALERSEWYGRLGSLLERVEGADWCQREEERP